jgi:three-Cys-motif partner protein
VNWKDWRASQTQAILSEGSARRALRIQRPFSKYIDPARAQHLQQLSLEHPQLNVTVEIDDANRKLKEFCVSTNWNRTRAVVFLDPFGSQVDYETIKLFGQTKAVDLWYLFPSFLSIFRQISSSGKMTIEQESSIRRVLGTDEWKSLWLKKTDTLDLFGSDTRVEKQVDVDDITKFMINKMKADFPGGVLDSWLPLGPKGAHWYSLIFAWANPSKNAALAGTLASAVMARK